MKPIYFLVFSILLASCAKVEVNLSQVEQNDGKVHLKDNPEPFSGIVNAYYPGDDSLQKQSMETFSDGIRDGLTTLWYKDGGKEKEGNYQNDKAMGKWMWWYPDGKVKQVVNYINGEVDGVYEIYYSNGQLWAKIKYSTGKPWESLEHYFNDGTPVGKNTLKDGNGQLFSYDENGNLQLTTTYEKGEELMRVQASDMQSIH